MMIKTDLTREEMQQIFAKRVHDALGMTIEQYREARHTGTLPQTDDVIALQVFSGEAGARQSSAEGEEHPGSKGPLQAIHSASGTLRTRKRDVLRRTITRGLRKLRLA